MSELFIAISGQITRENSANLMNFWKGFINIQSAIYGIDSLKIVSHSWNPEFDNIVKNVYNVDLLSSEVQGSFAKEFMPLINPVNKFEKGLRRSESTWKNVTPQTILGNLRSRAEAIKLLRNFDIDKDVQILATRWDQGCTGSDSVNNIIFDKSLDVDYHYISYYTAVDEGYADMWFISPYKLAVKFEQVDRYALDAFANKNDYFDNFTKNGWPLAIQKNKTYEFINKYKEAIINKILTRFNFNLFKKLLPFIATKVTGLEGRIKRKLERPFLSGENSLLISSKANVVFSNYQALNIHAILKSFTLDNRLREHTRFLDIKDFEYTHSGQMINPIEFSYVIYSHSSFSDCWDMAIKQAKECLPSNCKKIYLISDNSEETFKLFSSFREDDQVKLLTYENEEKYTNRLIKAFTEVGKNFDFIYFVHEDMPLVSKVNQVYLNSLLHYMNNSNEYYIKLVDTSYVDKKEDHDSFPSLVKNYGGYSFSIQASLLKPDFLCEFLANFDEDIYGMEKVCIESNLRFSAVKGNIKIGKYLLKNDYFPHISTAISKGKWVTSEWNEEINFLSKKYSIDLSVRGEV
jgi:hypothetical protein